MTHRANQQNTRPGRQQQADNEHHTASKHHTNNRTPAPNNNNNTNRPVTCIAIVPACQGSSRPAIQAGHFSSPRNNTRLRKDDCCFAPQRPTLDRRGERCTV